jgi:hypothetical protein
MSFKKNDYYTLLQQACDTVPGFKIHYHQFIEKAAVAQPHHELQSSHSSARLCENPALWYPVQQG